MDTVFSYSEGQKNRMFFANTLDSGLMTRNTVKDIASTLMEASIREISSSMNSRDLDNSCGLRLKTKKIEILMKDIGRTAKWKAVENSNTRVAIVSRASSRITSLTMRTHSS